MPEQRNRAQASTRTPRPDVAGPAGPDLPDAWLAAALADAAARYGPLGLSREELRRGCQDRLRRQGDRVDPRPLAGADLVLAIACCADLPGAWQTLIRTHQDRLIGLLCARGVPGAEARELVAELWGELALPPSGGGAPTRLATFGGACSLLGWLTVLLVRRRIDRARTRRGIAAVDAAEAATAAGEPAAAAAESEQSAQLLARLRAAWHTLTERERLALALRYGQDLPLAPIARALSVGVPRVSRILRSAGDRLASSLGRTAQARPDLDVWRDVLAALLANPVGTADKSAEGAT